VAVARSSSGGVAIRYVLPVLWMTSSFAVVGRMATRGRLNLNLLPHRVVRRCDTGGRGVWCLRMPCWSQVVKGYCFVYWH